MDPSRCKVLHPPSSIAGTYPSAPFAQLTLLKVISLTLIEVLYSCTKLPLLTAATTVLRLGVENGHVYVPETSTYPNVYQPDPFSTNPAVLPETFVYTYTRVVAASGFTSFSLAYTAISPSPASSISFSSCSVVSS